MDYSKLSDFEINRAVGEVILKGRWACKPGTADNNTDSWYYGSVDAFVTPYPDLPDYCNNPADAWPIIMGNRITLMPASKGDKWMSQAFDYAIADVSTNPLRSAMIVFLMMQDSEG